MQEVLVLYFVFSVLYSKVRWSEHSLADTVPPFLTSFLQNYGRAGQVTEDSMAHAHCMLNT